MAALASLMVVLSSALDAMNFSIIFCSGIIIETEGDISVCSGVFCVVYQSWTNYRNLCLHVLVYSE